MGVRTEAVSCAAEVIVILQMSFFTLHPQREQIGPSDPTGISGLTRS
jgi:hypothetical protein